MPNTWEASGRHIIRADVDERRRISNGHDEINVYLSSDEGVNDSEFEHKLEPKSTVVVDKTVHLYGHGPWITVEHTDEKADKVRRGSAKTENAASRKSAAARADASKDAEQDQGTSPAGTESRPDADNSKTASEGTVERAKSVVSKAKAKVKK